VRRVISKKKHVDGQTYELQIIRSFYVRRTYKWGVIKSGSFTAHDGS